MNMSDTGVFTALRTTLSGLSVQVKRLDIISENIANAEKSPDKNGKVYQKKVLTSKGSKPKARRSFDDQLKLKMRRTQSDHMQIAAQDIKPLSGEKNDIYPYKVKEEKGERMVYNPAHPDADQDGYVKMPDINPVEEMVDLISASRLYEANVTVMNAAKSIAKESLEI
jgi:flagellar basal-body rod protein FlgC